MIISKLNRYLIRKNNASISDHGKIMVENIINIIEKHVDISNLDELKEELYTSLPKIVYSNRSYDEKGLMDYLEISNIRSKVQAKDCFEAIDLVCDILIEKGSILQSYRESIKERLRKLGPPIW